MSLHYSKMLNDGDKDVCEEEDSEGGGCDSREGVTQGRVGRVLRRRMPRHTYHASPYLALMISRQTGGQRVYCYTKWCMGIHRGSAKRQPSQCPMHMAPTERGNSCTHHVEWQLTMVVAVCEHKWWW